MLAACVDPADALGVVQTCPSDDRDWPRARSWIAQGHGPHARPLPHVFWVRSVGQASVQVPLPGHSMLHGPVQAKSQSPLPLQCPWLPEPIAAPQLPEPVHSAKQSASQTKSQLPEPAHCRSQLPAQSSAQSPELGHTQSVPSHSQASPSSQTPPTQANEMPTNPAMNSSPIRSVVRMRQDTICGRGCSCRVRGGVLGCQHCPRQSVGHVIGTTRSRHQSWTTWCGEVASV
jgi:hypothetical protein